VTIQISTNLSSAGSCGRTCLTAQSRYPEAFKKISIEVRLLSVGRYQKLNFQIIGLWQNGRKNKESINFYFSV